MLGALLCLVLNHPLLATLLVFENRQTLLLLWWCLLHNRCWLWLGSRNGSITSLEFLAPSLLIFANLLQPSGSRRSISIFTLRQFCHHTHHVSTLYSVSNSTLSLLGLGSFFCGLFGSLHCFWVIRKANGRFSETDSLGIEGKSSLVVFSDVSRQIGEQFLHVVTESNLVGSILSFEILPNAVGPKLTGSNALFDKGSWKLCWSLTGNPRHTGKHFHNGFTMIVEFTLQSQGTDLGYIFGDGL
mmetsp:Transcript_11917/g.28548  ORF Transcript_11917/g.28548 Transcript_11917/m.28548 type:complete len:243 (+) Transcript_11917:1486-2214(+)